MSDLKNPGEGIDFGLFLDCVHCGLCTSACPTYTELGDENDGPRGRVYLMRQVAEGRLGLDARIRKHLDLCLDCRACETACPSGVHYGRLIEPFRLAVEEAEHQRSVVKRYDWFRQLVLFRLFPYANRIRLAMTPVRWLQRLGIYGWMERLGLFKLVPGRLGHMVTLVGPLVDQGPKLPKFLPAKGRRRARVAFFVGCVAEAMFRHTHWATLRVLQENGCDVLIPEGQGCCGAIHFHAGSSDGARKLADANVAAFDLAEIDAVIVNHGGCGAMLKEYGLHWHDDLQPARRRFAEKVKDINEFLDQLGLVPPSGRIEATATYHDACHLGHAQKVREAPRRLLAQIPGLALRELPETEICCGSAGTYNLNQPAMAQRLMRRKLENILKTGAQIVLASNAGCLLQIGREVRQRRAPLVVLHPMDLLDMSYRDAKPAIASTPARR
ncbi:MAG: (Fe-S)-binding protein [Thermoguttaceae bacterium]|jgi:glycolate oxidase iron-sulfur subunit|nr:(Fe-S)-binding protein [Thermoguttaceae bacterium]